MARDVTLGKSETARNVHSRPVTSIFSARDVHFFQTCGTQSFMARDVHFNGP
jgi:hypothetical protein